MSLSCKFGLTVFIVLVASGSLVRVEAQIPSEFIGISCLHKLNCRECIQTSGCGWCNHPDIENAKRCFQSAVEKNVCPGNYTYYPVNEMGIIKNVSLSRDSTRSGHGHSKISSSASRNKKFVQIYPQHVSIKLRLNEPYNLALKYARAEDYPIDLYYLMDLSGSMEDDKEQLSSLGELLASEMQKMTSNFRLGFGSFVEKTLFPYDSTVREKGSALPYGFRNHISLSKDISQFTNKVKSATVSTNLDAPEGGFDAIMQAVVCHQQIGWREQTRHLLVFTTDNGYHYAGDGKLGGLNEPNDGNCHLDEKGLEYTFSTEQDYPSIYQINHKVKENSINIIFAITASHINVYQKAAKFIEGSSVVELKNDSSNVVSIVREAYDKISSSIEIKDTAPSYINITYYSSCLTNETAFATSICDNVTIGDVVHFTAKIELIACPSNSKYWQQSMDIFPVGIDERLTIDLELLCSCDCEKKGYEEFSTKCHRNGTFRCGLCECNNKHIGQYCECSNDDMNQNSQQNCIPPNSRYETVCNGRGICECGQCKCDNKFYGKYCECSDYSCEYGGGKICSGNGNCKCGYCNCNNNWTGITCNCLNTVESCKAPGNDLICSGRGDCHCGKCQCHTNETEKYEGEFCQKCFGCTQRCDSLYECVECQAFGSGPLKDYCKLHCNQFETKLVTKLDIEPNEIRCSLYLEDGCKSDFKFTDVRGYLEVSVEKTPVCPPKNLMFGVALGVIVGTVFIGLAILLLWKLLTTIHDRYEFARFEKERLNAQWDNCKNPIFKKATTTFINPTYIDYKNSCSE